MRTPSWLVVVVIIAACGSPPSGGPDGAVADAAEPDAADLDAPADAPDAGVDPDAPGADAPDAGLGDPFAAIANLPPVCSSDGWCWSSPTPSGTTYTHIVSSGPDNIWITGGGPPGYAAILQWNGHVWIEHKPPMGTCAPGIRCEYAFPMSIATSGPNNTWLIYTNLTEHWDGTTWTIVDVEQGNTTVGGVWIDPAGDAWVTRSNGIVKIWHGHVATQINVGTGVGAIWGTAPDDVFMTTIGAVVHWNGSFASIIYSGGRTAGWYQGVRNDVWISGGDGVILHWDGVAITEQAGALIPLHAKVQSAQYIARNDVWWISSGVSASPEYFLHWDGTALETIPIEPVMTPLGDHPCGLFTSAKVIDGRYWLTCGDGGIATKVGTNGIQSVIAPMLGVGELWGTSTTDLYQALGSSLRHWDGAAWTTAPIRIVALDGLRGTGVGGANELFGVTTTITSGQYVVRLVHFDGGTWSSNLVLTTHQGYQKYIADVHPLGPDEAIAVGGLGTALHYKDGAVTVIDSGTTSNLLSVWGPDNDHLLIAGHDGKLLHWDRANPTVLTVDADFPATTDHLHRITGAGGVTWIIPENQVYAWMKPAAGPWQIVNTRVPPIAIVALSATNVVVAAQDSGMLARWNGAAFVIEYYPSWRGLQHLFALDDGTVYLAGNPGIIVHAP